MKLHTALPPAHALHCHPAAPCAALAALAVRVQNLGAAGWHLRYELAGDVARLRLPAPAVAAAFADGLWHHTCFEAFVAPLGAGPAGPGQGDDPGASKGGGAYREFNFSPCGRWAAYAFAAERQRAAQQPAWPAPRLACTAHPRAHAAPPPRQAAPPPGTPPAAPPITHWQLDAWLPAAWLPPGPWQLGLSAVIEAADGSLSYWALRHPAPQPDFHARSGWTATLPPPKVAE